MRYFKFNKSIIMSVIALLLILTLAIGATFSWVEGGDKGYVNGGNLVISTGSNLTMRQDGVTTNSIIIPTCTLEETSSADGRNYYFPLEGNTTNKTTTMTFREGIPEDKNSKYVSVDFQLEAQGGATDVYLGAGTIVQCSNKGVLDALRMSFNFNDGSAPKVFKPNQMPGVDDMSYSPITTITTAGKASTGTTETESYGDYYYQGDDSKPIFQLKDKETLNVTLSIWLEGTEFEGDAILDKNLNIFIDFTTTVDDLVKYNFIDNCHNRDNANANHWIHNTMTINNAKYDTMMYIFDVSSQRYYAMHQALDTDTLWETYIPSDINNFYFRRYSIDIDEWWNEWEPSMTNIETDPNGTHTYVAICGQENSEGTNLDGCYGYWQDSNDTIRVYFKLQAEWNNLKCYAWGDNNYYPIEIWPGSSMTFSHNDATDSKPIYYIDIKGASKLKGIQFNNSNDNDKYQIEDTQFFFNGLAVWYESSTKNGKWTYTDSSNSLIYPVNDPTT